MRDYDGVLFGAKQRALLELSRLNDPKTASPDRMAGAMDELNRAWDDVTNALIRQRDERDRIILKLVDELAERKKR